MAASLAAFPDEQRVYHKIERRSRGSVWNVLALARLRAGTILLPRLAANEVSAGALTSFAANRLVRRSGSLYDVESVTEVSVPREHHRGASRVHRVDGEWVAL